MMAGNILDDTHPENTQFTNSENKLMNLQLGSVTNLIEKYKKIIDILSKTQNKDYEQQLSEQKKVQENGKQYKNQQVHPEINKILKQAEEAIQKCITDCKEITNNKYIFLNEQSNITPAFFAELVLSFEKTIAQLKQSIHQRQILLQQLQTRPNHPMKRPQQPTESSAIIKAIQSYDIYPKISEKCRKQILELKQKKKLIQLAYKNNVNIKSKESQLSKKQHLSNSIQIDKTVRKISQYSNNSQINQINYQNKTQIQIQILSPFEKAILIYKKKKIFNDILQARVIDLKKKIKEKQQCNKVLKKRLQNEVWENIQNINYFGKNLDEDNPAYLSMLNQSIRANNLDFSIDISRVVDGANFKNQVPSNLNLHNILAEVDNQHLKQKV